MDDELTDAQRYPLLTEAGRDLLRWMHEHEAAPRFNHRCGDRLTADGLARVRAFGDRVAAGPELAREGALPAWVMPFAAGCYRDVPFYRGRGSLPGSVTVIPTCARGNLSREPWRFVPDSQPLDDLIVYTTSGTTTGHSLEVLSHPEAAAMYLPLLQAALATRGVRLTGGAGRVSIVLVCWQRRTYTYATVLSTLDAAGYAKINLNPVDWRDPDDRSRYLDACAPELYTGDPLAFAALAELPLASRPAALISTAMALLPGLRRELEAHFDCPVLDLYSLNEAGPVAVEAGGVHAPIQPRLYIEIVDAAGQPCPPGVAGEIALTGGFNPFLPLLRYRTGDTAALALRGDRPVLVGLEGRAPVIFRGRAGQPINNVDVSAALKSFALAQFTLHQAAAGDLRLRVRSSLADPAAIRAALLGLFGADQPLTIEEADMFNETGGKVMQYTSAFSGG